MGIPFGVGAMIHVSHLRIGPVIHGLLFPAIIQLDEFDMQHRVIK